MASRQGRQQDYGQRWGEGAARCFSLEGDFLDETQGPRLMPVPDSFFCPISSAIMVDPVATVDGCAYEREYIERWFRERRQMRQMITSPMTGLELPSTTLMPLLALQRAIEAYLVCRPEIRKGHMAARSFEEAACVLQVDLLEKEAITASTHEELRRLREAHRSLQRELRRSEGTCASLNEELRRTREWARTLEDEKGAALQAGIDARRDAAPCSSTAPSLVGDNATDIATSADEAPSSLRAAVRPGALVHRQPLEGGVPKRPAFLGTPAAPLIRRGGAAARGAAVAAAVAVEAATYAGEGIGAGAAATKRRWPSLPSMRVLRTAIAALLALVVAVLLPPLLCLLMERPESSLAGLSQAFGVTSWPSFPGVTSWPSLPDVTTWSTLPTLQHVLDRVGAALPDASWMTDDGGSSKKPERVAANSWRGRRETAGEGGWVLPEKGAAAEGLLLEPGGDTALGGRSSSAAADSPASSPTPVQGGVDAAAFGGFGPLRRQTAALQPSATTDPAGIAASAAKVEPSSAEPRQGPTPAAHAGPAAAASAAAASEADAGGSGNTAGKRFVSATADGSDGISFSAGAATKAATPERPLVGSGGGTGTQGREQRGSGIAAAAAGWVEMLRSGRPFERRTAMRELTIAVAEGRPEERRAVLKSGVAIPLAKLLEDEEESLRELAAIGVGALAGAGGAEAQAAIAKAGAIPALVKLVQAEAEVLTQRAAAAALRNLAAGHSRNQAVIAQAGAVAPLVRLLKDGDAGTQTEAAAALGNLAGEASRGQYEKQVTIARAGAIAPLVRLLHSDDGPVRRAAAGALRMLATDNADNQVAIAQAGAIPLLVRLLGDEEPGVRGAAAAALGNLAFYHTETNEGNQVAIAEAGAVAPLVLLLLDPAAGVCEAAAGTLRNLAARNVENAAAVVKAGGVASLTRLLRDGGTWAQEEAVGVLRNLVAESPANQAAVASAGAVEALLKLLDSKEGRLREEARATLHFLARDNPEVREAVQRAGGATRPGAPPSAAGSGPGRLGRR